MMTQTVAEAYRLELEAVLEEAGVPAVVTLDPTEAAPALDSGQVLAVVITAPSLTYPTWHQVRAEWAVWVIAGPPTDHLAAWSALDSGLVPVADALEAESAEPAAFRDAQGHEYPAYIVRTSTDHNKE